VTSDQSIYEDVIFDSETSKSHAFLCQAGHEPTFLFYRIGETPWKLVRLCLYNINMEDAIKGRHAVAKTLLQVLFIYDQWFIRLSKLHCIIRFWEGDQARRNPGPEKRRGKLHKNLHKICNYDPGGTYAFSLKVTWSSRTLSTACYKMGPVECWDSSVYCRKFHHHVTQRAPHKSRLHHLRPSVVLPQTLIDVSFGIHYFYLVSVAYPFYILVSRYHNHKLFYHRLWSTFLCLVDRLWAPLSETYRRKLLSNSFFWTSVPDFSCFWH